MSVLQVNPDSSALVHVAAAVVLYLHISAGSVGLLSGAAALALRKGSRLHRLSGQVFVGTMLIMSAIGACVAPFLPVPERASVVAGALTFYLVLTAWTAVRRKVGRGGAFDAGVLLASLCITAAGVTFIWMAAQSPTGTLDGQPREAFYLFVLIGTVAVVGDIRLILGPGVAGAVRIARHLWRMCAALFIANASLLQGQQQVFAQSLRGSPWLLVPLLVVVALLLFWLCRVYFSASYRQRQVLHTP